MPKAIEMDATRWLFICFNQSLSWLYGVCIKALLLIISAVLTIKLLVNKDGFCVGVRSNVIISD